MPSCTPSSSTPIAFAGGRETTASCATDGVYTSFGICERVGPNQDAGLRWLSRNPDSTSAGFEMSAVNWGRTAAEDGLYSNGSGYTKSQRTETMGSIINRKPDCRRSCSLFRLLLVED